jgi:adenosylcobinamide-phosphate synthase
VDELIGLVLGFVLDQLLGDPPSWPHPVRWIGRLIQRLESPLRRWLPERLGGVILALVVVGLTGGVVWGLLELSCLGHPVAQIGVITLLIYWGLAARSLDRETEGVLDACRREDWPEARRRLAGIVGRDTHELPPADIYRACTETVAENTADGIVAPLFFAALAGPVGLWIYKAVNTLDSMVGYRSPQYLRFGWAAARADDLLNFIPARITAILLALGAMLMRGRCGQALRIAWRDGRKHPSPNAGWPEAAMAGALGVQLGGPSSYGGVASEKPLLGDPEVMLRENTVQQALRVMMGSAWLAFVFALIVTAARVAATRQQSAPVDDPRPAYPTPGTGDVSATTSARPSANWPRTG